MFLVLGALRLSRIVLDKFPDMLSSHLLSRLLPERNVHPWIGHLLRQCDDLGFHHNCLVPLKHCLESPGGPLKYTLEGHSFAVFGCSLTSDHRYVISTSTRHVQESLLRHLRKF